jgi:hypothetical protein
VRDFYGNSRLLFGETHSSLIDVAEVAVDFLNSFTIKLLKYGISRAEFLCLAVIVVFVVKVSATKKDTLLC